LASLKAAVWVLFAPAVATAQDNPDFFLPDLDSDLLLMAELVEATVTFVDPTGIGALNDLHFGSLDRNLSDQESVTVAPDSTVTDSANRVVGGSQAPASLNVTAAPGQAITILVDAVDSGPGYSLADFRCKYDAGSDTACDGPGYSEISVASGTLLVGVTLVGQGNAVAGAADGSFDVTISYQ
jgi:hypothetical protein